MGDRLISKGAAIAWPPQSPDLTPPYFFLWGHVKEVLFKDSPENLRELKEAVRVAISGILQETCTSGRGGQVSTDLVLGPKRGLCRKAVNMVVRKRAIGSCSCCNKTLDTDIQNGIICICVECFSSEIYKKQMVP